MPSIPSDASKGLVTARDPSTLRSGELAEATGCEYRIGSPHLYKQAGRSSLDADLGAPIQGLVKAQYDTASDVLIAVAGGEVFESPASVSPTFTASGLDGLPATPTPHFCGYNERWIMCMGSGSNYIRESAPPPSGTTGNWRQLGMQRPTVIPTATVIAGTATPVLRPSSSSGSYATQERAYDTATDTYAQGNAGTTVTYDFSGSFSASNCNLFIDHQATEGSRGSHEASGHGKQDSGGSTNTAPTPSDVTMLTEYSVNNGTSWSTIGTGKNFARTTISKPLTIGTSIAANLLVRFTSTGTTQFNHRIFDIRVSDGSTGTSYTTSGDSLVYGYTELYTDSDDVEFESLLSELVSVLSPDVDTNNGITLTLGVAVNSFATQYGIYRSVDGDGTGGYPFMYRIATMNISDGVVFIDDFELPPNEVPEGKEILSTFTIIYPTGETLIVEANGPPPPAKMSLPFQGVMTYVPSQEGQGHYLFYSLASSISTRGMEQVPSFQYLDFQTPRNDTITSIAVTNGGKSLLVFFATYTMLVNYLPQASDGVFDNRIKEYVSNNRGSSGRLTSCEFTLSTGQTLVASVDTLGLWVTNGVNQMDEWSRDLAWDTDMTGADLDTASLVDNTPKRRLELLYTDANGDRQERHFFYGRLKEDGDGKPSPLHTGPHPSGTRSKTYTQIGTDWVGFSGDASTIGDVFLEGGSDADEAHGYDTTGIVPFAWTMGDIYIGGISNAHILESGVAKFTSDLSKEFTVAATFFRDVGKQNTQTKILGITVPSNLYFHAYCERHRIRFTDLTATAAPAFVGYEVDVRPAGPSRDK